MHRSVFSIAGALATALIAWPAGANPALAEALASAWARSAPARSLPHRQAQADAQARQAAGWTPGPPSVGLAHSNDRLSARSGRQEWEIEVATPLWLPGQRQAQQTQAQARQALQSAQAAGQRLELAGALRDAWWQLAASRDASALAARRLASAQALQADVERRWRVGELARTDANSAGADAKAVQAELVAAERESRQAAARWRALTGAAPPAALDEEAAAPVAAVPEADPRWAAAAAAVAAARAQLQLAERSARDAPELALRWVRERGGAAEPFASTLGVQLRLPLSSAPKGGAELAGLRAELAQAQVQLDLLSEQWPIEVDDARRDLDAAAQSQALAHGRALLAADSLQLLQKSFALGETDLPTLLRARADAFNAEAEQARQTLARAAANSRLHQAMGLLP